MRLGNREQPSPTRGTPRTGGWAPSRPRQASTAEGLPSQSGPRGRRQTRDRATSSLRGEGAEEEKEDEVANGRGVFLEGEEERDGVQVTVGQGEDDPSDEGAQG